MRAQLRVIGMDPRSIFAYGKHWLLYCRVSRPPRIEKPQRGQQVERSILVATIVSGNRDQQVICIRLRIFHEHIEGTVLIEDARIEQLIIISR
jgi:hypothetical protein